MPHSTSIKIAAKAMLNGYGIPTFTKTNVAAGKLRAASIPFHKKNPPISMRPRRGANISDQLSMSFIIALKIGK
jgi:hypothetical protein